MEGFTVKSSPKRIWTDWKSANYACVAFDEPPASDAEGFRIEYLLAAEHDRLMAEKDAEIARLREGKDQAYEERNRLVALLASMFPSGRSVTDIPGWSSDWHGCVYIDFPWGQASWHFHDSQAHLFEHLPTYVGSWDGRTTEGKYAAIARAALGGDNERG